MKLSPWKLAGLFGALLFMTIHSWTKSLNPPARTARLTLAASENSLKSQDTFSCSDTIHGTLTLPEPAVGRNLLEADWIAPDGSIQENSHVNVEFPSSGRRTAYIWARLTGSGEGMISSMKNEENAPANFSGVWNVVVRWNSKVLIEKPFNLKC